MTSLERAIICAIANADKKFVSIFDICAKVFTAPCGEKIAKRRIATLDTELHRLARQGVLTKGVIPGIDSLWRIRQRFRSH